MKNIFNIIKETYYLQKFGSYISKVFKNDTTPKNDKGLIIVELNNLYGSHIAYSFIIDKLKKKFLTNNIGLFKSSFDSGSSHYLLHKFLNYFNLHYYNWYKAMGNSIFIFHKTKNKNLYKHQRLLKKIKSKKNLLKFKIEGILYGDLIYDSFLRYNREHTIDINSEDFKIFFLKSIDYYYFCKNLFLKHNIHCVLLSHTVYLPAILGRIALSKNKLFFCSSLTHCANLSKKFFYLENFREYKKLFLQLPQKQKNSMMKKAKENMEKHFKGKITDQFENLQQSPFAGTIKKNLVPNSPKIKILVATHCFADSPHVHGDFLFDDFYDWVENLGKVSERTDYEWYIKPHPNKYHEPKNLEVIKDFIKKYKKFKIIDNNYSHFSYMKNIDFFLSVDGHIAEEMAYFNKKVILASKSGKIGSYKFVFNPTTKKKYINLLLNLNKKLKLKINKKEIILAHCINHIYIHQNYLIQVRELSNKIGWSNIGTIEVIKFWINNFNKNKHKKMLKNVSDFVDLSVSTKKYNRYI